MNPDDRIRELINAWCSGHLDEESLLELEDRLRQSPDARRLFLEYRATESALRSASLIRELSPAPDRRRWKDRALAGLAVTVVALLGCFVLLWPSRSDTTIATVVEIAILDVNNSLRRFLESAGVPYVEFDADTPKSTPVFVSRAAANNPQQKQSFADLKRFVEGGGTAIYLETIQRWSGNPWGGGKLPGAEALPVETSIRPAKGLWVGISHVVTDHPIFDGLPSNCMMDQIYENIWSPQTLMDLPGQKIVASVSHGWFRNRHDQRNYLGPEPAWCGTDLGVVPHGQGRYVLSGLRVLEHLGSDPVADKILFNMIQWATQQ